MRAFIRTCRAFLIALAIGQLTGVATAKPLRTAQIIDMVGQAPSPSEGATEQKEEQPPREPVAEGASFRVHDLSRRWVEFEMGQWYRAMAGDVPHVSGDDPFAHVGVADLGAYPGTAVRQPPASAIQVPAWMRDGAAFSQAATNYAPRCATSAYRPSGFLNASTEIRRFGYYGLMSAVACEYGIPTGLFDAMIIRESNYQPSAYSPKRAFGLTQLMPDTAIGLGVNPYDIEQNLRGGARYLRRQLDRFGQVHLALAAYNAGPERVRNGMLPRIAETQAYVENVLLNWRRLSEPANAAGDSGLYPVPSTTAARTIRRSASVSVF